MANMVLSRWLHCHLNLKLASEMTRLPRSRLFLTYYIIDNLAQFVPEITCKYVYTDQRFGLILTWPFNLWALSWMHISWKIVSCLSQVGWETYSFFSVIGCCRRYTLCGTYTWRTCMDMGPTMATWRYVWSHNF